MSRKAASWFVPMRNVVITGGSRGLGLGIAKALAAAGYSAICISRSRSDELNQAIEDVERTRQGALEFLPFDLLDVEKIPNLVEMLRKKHGTVYGLVNNAGLGLGGILATMQNA